MPIEYSQEQVNTLRERMSFLKNMKTFIFIATLFFYAILASGIALIYYHLAFIGVVIILVSILPCIVISAALSYASIILSALKKGEYMVFEVECQSAKKLDGNGMWYEIELKNKHTMYYYTEEPNKEIPQGTLLHSIVCKSKHSLMFCVDPIEDVCITTNTPKNVETINELQEKAD